MGGKGGNRGHGKGRKTIHDKNSLRETSKRDFSLLKLMEGGETHTIFPQVGPVQQPNQRKVRAEVTEELRHA